ncbi:MAG: hypothetical protein E6J91_11735 [Deltaproteobacteria bacterium]|nr:MAG: hypothetical protein E6J91_11735 [Deltaproteobacteria bacterium]
MSVAITLVLATTGIVMYVRDIAIERDRADEARLSAQRERDRARLSEASLLLERDPTRARELLADLKLQSAQYAMVTSRARQLAATHVVPISAVVDGMFRVPGGATVQLVTRDGDFRRLDPATGTLETLDHDLTGAVAYRAGQWLYARRSYGVSSVQIATPLTRNLFDTDLQSVALLAAVNDAVYALDASGDLYRLDGKTAATVDHGVRNIVGEGDLRMVCKVSGELQVLRKDAVILRATCPTTKSWGTMAVVHDDYAALTADGTLLAVRRDHRIEIPTQIHGEYELALSPNGVIAVADYSKAASWFVRPGSSNLEAGPVHASRLLSVAADGNLAAWGYGDGTVIVLDTALGTVWELRGHAGPVFYVVVDAARARLIASGPRELRVSELKPPAAALVSAMPCAISHIEPSPDGTHVALDCNDGTVRVWSRDTGAVTLVHAHAGTSFGVEWLNGEICSGGFRDGHVICSRPDGSGTRTIESGTNRILWLTTGPHHDTLIYASAEGKLWLFDGKPRELYTHPTVYRLAVSADGHLLGSCALDGSLSVYDLVKRKLIAHLADHTGPAYSLAWVDEELWTAGDDGFVSRWQVRDDKVSQSHHLQIPPQAPRTASSVRLMKALHAGWVVNAGEDVLLLGRHPDSYAFGLNVGSTIAALDASPDMRYVAAGVDGEIIVVDFARSAIATMSIGAPAPKQLSFVDPTSLAFAEVAALKLIQVDHLDYVPFQLAETPNDASF